MALHQLIVEQVSLRNLPVFLLVVLGLAVLFRKLSSNNQHHKQKGWEPIPRYWQWDPIWGLDLVASQIGALRSNRFLDWLASLHASMSHTKTFAINMFGVRWVYTYDPEVLKAVYATHFKDFGVTPIGNLRRGLTPFADKGAITTDGDEWRHSRLLIQPFFDRQVYTSTDRVARHTNQFIKLLPNNGETVDLQPLLQRWFLDIATEFIFGESTEALVYPERAKIANTMLDVLDGGRLRAQLNRLMFLRDWTPWLKSVEEIHSFVTPPIQQTIKEKEERDRKIKQGETGLEPERTDLLWTMVQNLQDVDELRSQICLILVANIDTTSVFISNCVWWLARYPDVWDNIRQEVAELGDIPMSFSVLRNMKYLNCVMNETHRMIPNNVSQLRGAFEDVVIPAGGGPNGKSPTLIRKGDLVLINKTVMYRDPEVWGDDANEFKPERFDGYRGSWQFLPFGGGPRRCPAQMMVQTEAAYILAHLAKTYSRIEPRDPAPYVPVMRIGPSNKTGVKIAMYK
ncbi:hypothetical protein NW762_012583 [Fusarium torreyae]|uniref:Uncharacterized protein n=1 Tax=Fusarium torreyae TaxID=1237075 RepID=A0A9W8VB70_9HYPO|nr:hypothetical protein NW762_012583 [Fusarium torreyae]